jgi:DNA polymerase
MDLESLRLLYGNPMEVFSSNIRGCIIPTKDHTLFCGDYAAIEARVLFWLAGHEEGLEAYREGRDLYREMATKIYRVKLDDVTPAQREVAKRAILGSGYGMGHKKFRETCALFGVDVSEALAETAVNAYRNTHIPVPELWKNIESAAIMAVLNKGKIYIKNQTAWWAENNFLWCQLPSGRRLAYARPSIRGKQTPWGESKRTLHHYGVNGITKQWQEEHTYGGRLVENITQAVARDIMAEAMLRLDANGFQILLSVHDELLTEKKNGQLEQFKNLMEHLPEWANGLPIKTDVWTGERYRK